MKGAFVAAVAAMAGAASAGANHRRAHELFARSGELGVAAPTGSMCIPGCTTIWKTITGEPTLVPVKTVTATRTNTTTTTCTVTPKPTTTEVIIVVPTPEVETCPTPGTYTFPATTITVTDTTTVCGATTTKVPTGTHTYGGVTTVVETATTVTCPIATVETSGTVTTSTIRMTEYVCPSAGTFTINPTTTVCAEETVIVYPTVTTIVPGTYTRPETVVTVTETGYVTVCPYTSSGLVTSTPAPEPKPEPKPQPKPQPKPEPKPQPKPEPKPEHSAPAPAPKPVKTETPSKPSGGSGGPGPTTNTNQLGITYTCYEPTTGACKSAEQVEKDIAELANAGFKNIRIYGTDCNTIENVTPPCKKYGVKIVTGIFVKPGTSCSAQNPDVKQQIEDLASKADWSIVDLLVVSNESIMNGICTPAELKELIKAVKSGCSAYEGPYTIAETLNVWERSDVTGALCDVIDMVGLNIHAYFNRDVSPSQAGDFVLSQLELGDSKCSGKKGINLECGWPNGGNDNGKALANPQAQAEAIKSIKAKAGSRTFLFSLDNDDWKPPGPCNCERKWGMKAALGM